MECLMKRQKSGFGRMTHYQFEVIPFLFLHHYPYFWLEISVCVTPILSYEYILVFKSTYVNSVLAMLKNHILSIRYFIPYLTRFIKALPSARFQRLIPAPWPSPSSDPYIFLFNFYVVCIIKSGCWIWVQSWSISSEAQIEHFE